MRKVDALVVGGGLAPSSHYNQVHLPRQRGSDGRKEKQVLIPVESPTSLAPS